MHIFTKWKISRTILCIFLWGGNFRKRSTNKRAGNSTHRKGGGSSVSGGLMSKNCGNPSVSPKSVVGLFAFFVNFRKVMCAHVYFFHLLWKCNRIVNSATDTFYLLIKLPLIVAAFQSNSMVQSFQSNSMVQSFQGFSTSAFRSLSKIEKNLQFFYPNSLTILHSFLKNLPIFPQKALHFFIHF